MKHNRARYLASARRVVVKVGSNTLSLKGGLNLPLIESLSEQLCELIDGGREMVLVSSGAMAVGVSKLGLYKRPDPLPMRQAVSAVGQAGLMMAYEKAFERYGKHVAQVLLTGDGLHDRKRYLNARNTLHTLMAWKIVPIINENDTVSVEEINFGDNDNLSAMIALTLNADLLINLTDIEGLLDKDPRVHPDAALIPFVDGVDSDLEALVGDIPGELGTGGMLAKLRAARKVNTAGIPMIIARGTLPDILRRLFSSEEIGTFFVPKANRMPNRKSWIGFTTKPEGALQIDDGAVRALTERGKSLLAIGILAVEGDFEEGAPVVLRNRHGDAIGTGLVNYRASDIRRILRTHSDDIAEKLGGKPYDEVVHRDNLTVTARRAKDS